MAIIGNISEIAMKDQESINKQIQIAENEPAGLDAKRTALQDRIRQLLPDIELQNLKGQLLISSWP